MTITFEQIRERVAAHYAQFPQITSPMTALTPLGAATRSVYQLRRQLAALDADDRAAAAAQIAALLSEVSTLEVAS